MASAQQIQMPAPGGRSSEVRNVSKSPKYFIVDAQALPEIFSKVVQARELLELGEAATVNDATRQVGISRSAFYKYKDMVRPFNDMMNGHIVTFQAMLRDRPGILSGILNIFAESGGNILTINQSVPTHSVAAVTLSAETSTLLVTLEELVNRVSEMEGVIRFEVLAG
jgi:chorismate mutase